VSAVEGGARLCNEVPDDPCARSEPRLILDPPLRNPWNYPRLRPRQGQRRRIEAIVEPAKTSQGERCAMSKPANFVRFRQPDDIDDPYRMCREPELGARPRLGWPGTGRPE
jgi:hypothetical protein